MSGIAAVVGSPASGGAVTPGSVNWPDIYGPSSASTIDQAISGISTPIVLQISLTGGAGLYYMLNDTTWVSMVSGGTITCKNGDKLAFLVTGLTISGTVTVTNLSDSSTVLDTFTYVLVAF